MENLKNGIQRGDKTLRKMRRKAFLSRQRAARPWEKRTAVTDSSPLARPRRKSGRRPDCKRPYHPARTREKRQSGSSHFPASRTICPDSGTPAADKRKTPVSTPSFHEKNRSPGKMPLSGATPLFCAENALYCIIFRLPARPADFGGSDFFTFRLWPVRA